MNQPQSPSIPEMLTELRRNRFYGSVELVFKAGRLTVIRRTETLLPNPEAESPRKNLGDPHEEQSFQ